MVAINLVAWLSNAVVEAHALKDLVKGECSNQWSDRILVLRHPHRHPNYHRMENYVHFRHLQNQLLLKLQYALVRQSVHNFLSHCSIMCSHRQIILARQIFTAQMLRLGLVKTHLKTAAAGLCTSVIWSISGAMEFCKGAEVILCMLVHGQGCSCRCQKRVLHGMQHVYWHEEGKAMEGLVSRPNWSRK